ncbi:putative RNA-directed DNA polymerase [Tanacetum coccineum]
MVPNGLKHKPLIPNDGSVPPKARRRPKGVKNRSKSIKIKVQSLRSASVGAGAILKILRNSKLAGKERSQCEASPMEGKGKHFNPSNSHVDEVLVKVLDRIAYDKDISSQMVFKKGSNVNDKPVFKVSKDENYCLINSNDGSFINNHLETSLSNEDNRSEHIKVENTRKANKDEVRNGLGDYGFVFGNIQGNKGILKKPSIGLTNVQFGPSLFYKSGNVWNNKSGLKALNSDGTLNIESFVEKMKKGVEDRELQMNFTPQYVFKNSDRSKRIAISVEDIKKGSEACALQLYGYFVGTSIDYRVVNANLSRMWRAHGISDITKTSAGLFYFKFKSEEGMKIPPQCSHCKTFGHSTVSCKVMPRTEDEIAAQEKRNAGRSSDNVLKQDSMEMGEDDGFISVVKNGGEVSSGLKQSNKTGNANVSTVQKKNVRVDGVNGRIVHKSHLSTRYNEDFKPKVLVMGSGSKPGSVMIEDLSLKNAFQALVDHDMIDKVEDLLGNTDEEYVKVIWPKLQLEVEEIMKSGGYPSLGVRINWSLAQLDFFYKNCSSFGMDPYVEDDDVESENEGTVEMMKPENADISGLVPEYIGTNKYECIVVGWDPNAVRIVIHSQSAQVMNLFVEAVNGHQRFFCSFIYAHVKSSGRKALWRDLIVHSLAVNDNPWTLLGDFNIILEPSERSMGSSIVIDEMEDFRDCLCKIKVVDLIMSGLQFTWNKSPGNPCGLLMKLDRVMGNVHFLEKFLNANALFLPFITSDHTQSVLNIPSIPGAKPKPFKFANFLASKPKFLPTVKPSWCKNVQGCSMFSVVSKLKSLKKPLRKLKYAHGDLADKVKNRKEELCNVQAHMVNDPTNENIRQKEAFVLGKFKEAVRDEEFFLKQRSKINWLSEGDHNTKSVDVDPILDSSSLFSNKLSLDDAEFMVRLVSHEEIKAALFSMEDDKAPRPDGFSSKFFKASWSVVGPEFFKAIQDFFSKGKLLKEINATIIALVPKIKTPKKVSDFRPISCCNVLYKCISKISDNIMLTRELMRNYHRKNGPPKVAFKIDINKAYDSVEWGFLRQCLINFGFPWKMTNWIMNCMSSPSFTVSINGNHHGFFKGYRGLRQGYPLSPYLFTLVMEVKLTHLCFADDLMLFSNGDADSVSILKNSLVEFSKVSGLVPNLDKSVAFFGNVPNHSKRAILRIMSFAKGSLLIRYLGVPLISSRLYKKLCDPLIDKVKQRLINWKNKVLSFAGRLQLIQSVLSSIQVFWSSVFILHVSVSQDIERIMRGFLWSLGGLVKGMPKVRWDDVYGLKIQGGLGIKSLHTWNVALMSKHVWNLFSKQDSLWVKWINSYMLVDRRSCERNFWDIPILNDTC